MRRWAKGEMGDRRPDGQTSSGEQEDLKVVTNSQKQDTAE